MTKVPDSAKCRRNFRPLNAAYCVLGDASRPLKLPLRHPTLLAQNPQILAEEPEKGMAVVIGQGRPCPGRWEGEPAPCRVTGRRRVRLRAHYLRQPTARVPAASMTSTTSLWSRLLVMHRSGARGWQRSTQPLSGLRPEAERGRSRSTAVPGWLRPPAGSPNGGKPSVPLGHAGAASGPTEDLGGSL